MCKIKLIFSNNVTIDGNRILSLNGLDSISSTINKIENPTGNGSIALGSSVNERPIIIKHRVKKEIADKMHRTFLVGSKIDLKINTRQISTICEVSELNWDKGYYSDPIHTIGLIAPDPFFYNTSNFGKNIAGAVGTFGFPWKPKKGTGVEFGYKIFSDTALLNNDGDSSAGVKVKFQAVRGDSKNIILTNLKTDEYIKINTTIKKNDVVEISTIVGNKYIKQNNVNIFNKMDKMSSFFQLGIGENALKYDSDLGRSNLDVYLYYTPSYQKPEVVKYNDTIG